MSADLARLREIVPGGNFVVLDTETTGIDYRAEVVQIAIVNAMGEALVNTLVKPTCRIAPDAIAIHGITDEMVAGAPTIGEVEADVRNAVRGRTVIIYNAEYDMRLLYQSSRARSLDVNWRDMAQRWVCAMLAYAEHRGEPGRRYGEFKWHKLGAAARFEGVPVGHAHAALDDCITTLGLIRKLARPSA